MSIGGLGATPQLPQIFPELFQDTAAQVSNPNRIDIFGTPDASNLSNSGINFLFNSQRGSYNVLAGLPLEQQAALAEEADDNNVRDLGNLVNSQDFEFLRNTPFYQQFKEVWGNLSSTELYQQALSLDPNTPQYIKDAFKMLGDKKANIARQARGNFNRIMATLRQPDEEAERIAQEAEKSAQRVARLAAGLDAEGGEEGMSS